jgi:hypothetical protein
MQQGLRCVCLLQGPSTQLGQLGKGRHQQLVGSGLQSSASLRGQLASGQVEASNFSTTSAAPCAAPGGGWPPPGGLPSLWPPLGAVRHLHMSQVGADREGGLHLVLPQGGPCVTGSSGVALSPPVAAVQQAAGELGSERRAGGSHMLLLPWEVLAWEHKGGALAWLAGCCDDV